MSVRTFNDWSTSVTALAVPLLWQSALAAGLVAGICWLLRRSTPVLRYWCWQVVALKLLLMPWWIVAIPLPGFFGAEAAGATENGERRLDAAMDSRIAPPDGEASVTSTEIRRWFDFLGDFTWRSWLVVAWLAGIAWQVGCMLIQHDRLRRLLSRATAGTEPRLLAVLEQVAAQLGLSQRPTLLLTNGQGIPFVCGLLRPVLVLPRGLMAELGQDHWREVVLHELAHLKRRDLWWSWLPTLARVVYFFHPVAHWVWFRIRLERELACDQLAMTLSGRSAADYAEVLVQVVSYASMPGALAMNSLEGLSTFWKRRLTMLLFTSKSSPKLSRLTCLAIALTAISACLVPTFRHAPTQALAHQADADAKAKDDKKEKTKPDSETIQGGWEVGSLSEGGGGSPKEAEQLKNALWVFEKEKMLWKLEGEDKIPEATYKLDSTKTPKTIDLTVSLGELQRHIEGIYTLVGDELTICIPLGQDTPRPTEFNAPQGTERSLFALKRKK